MPIDDLIKVCPPPAVPVNRPTAEQWNQLETLVGQRLPRDYRAFLDRYGSGVFGSHEPNGFFDLAWLLSPGQPPDKRDLNAVPLMTQLTEKSGELHREFPKDFPHPVWPEPGGLLFVGGTTTQHDLYWKTAGDPESWTCVMCDRGCDNWFHSDGDLTSLLAAMVTRRVPEWILEGPTRFPLVFLDLDSVDKLKLV